MLIAILESLRPKQWIKNLFVFAALAFSRNLTNSAFVITTLKTFIIFCLVSSACYIINDILDIRSDRVHPVKSKRPIAAGRLAILPALLIAFLLLAISLIGAIKLSVPLFNIVLFYALLQLLYSFVLKKMMIVDALAIATGFVLRMIAGGVAIDIAISKWLYICTISLSLFLAFCKRQAEITISGNPEAHRNVLEGYSLYLLNQMISILTAFTLVAYTLYTLSEETVSKVGSQNLALTIPFVLYGIFRYLYLVHKKQQGGEPENIILTDKPLLLDILLWGATILIIFYTKI
jgi:4-hydroxybenzoate polyprenyltransferase